MVIPNVPASSTTSETASIAAVHPDIIRTHILTRLDGPTLAAVTCVSAQLGALSTEDDLWKDVSTTKWPSTKDPRVSQAVSSFPSGHRSLFSDSYPVLNHMVRSKPTQSDSNHLKGSSSSELISAVDLYYKNDVIYSKVHVSETESGWFRCSPFRIDLLDQKELIPTGIRNNMGLNSDEWLNHLEENLTLSWILIDPTQNRAANLSTRDPVSVQRHWLTGDVQVRYSTIVAGGRRGSATELVQVGTQVTFGGGKKGGDEVVNATEMTLQMEDMEGRTLTGKDSLAILQAAMDGGKRKKWARGEGKVKLAEYEETKRERKRRQQERERALDFVCIAAAVTFFVAVWSFVLFR